MELVELDETFHERLMAMSNNAEMLRVLRNVNARIRFVRWIDMDSINRSNTQAEHRAVVDGPEGARRRRLRLGAGEAHRPPLDRITSAIKEGYAQIYMPAAATSCDELGFVSAIAAPLGGKPKTVRHSSKMRSG